jgi:hypothetical protein
MIVDGIILIIYTFVYALTAVFRLAQDVSLPTTMTSTIANASSYISALNDFLPITELVILLVTIFFIYETTYFIYKLIMWVVRKIPTIS